MKRNLYLILSLCIASYFCQTTAKRQPDRSFCVIQFTDPQMGFMDSKGTFSLQPEKRLMDQAVNIIRQRKPDFVIGTGDFLHLALNDSATALFEDYIGKIREVSKLYMVPGNHDLGITTVYKYEATNQKTALSAEEKMADATAFKTFYENYGYAGSTIDPNGSISYVAEPVSGLVILGIDSHNASVGEATLNWLCSQASAATAAGKQVIAMMHHPLFPHITGANLFIDTYTVDDYDFIQQGAKVLAIPRKWKSFYNQAAKVLQVMHAGITIGEIKGKDLIPDQSLALSTERHPQAFPTVELTVDEALSYLRKETLPGLADSPKGYTLVTCQGLPLGFLKNLGNRTNNLYPQEWRIKSSHITAPCQIIHRNK